MHTRIDIIYYIQIKPCENQAFGKFMKTIILLIQAPFKRAWRWRPVTSYLHKRLRFQPDVVHTEFRPSVAHKESVGRQQTVAKYPPAKYSGMLNGFCLRHALLTRLQNDNGRSVH